MIDCCVRRQAYHQERLAYWKGEAKVTEDKIRSEGMKLEEFQVTGGTRFEAKINESLGRRLSEAKSKAASHDAFLEQFTVFLAEFRRQPDREMPLQLGDVIYFGLHGIDDEVQQ